MKKLLPLVLLVASLQALAQQDPIYAQYMLNPQLINPAYVGVPNNLNINASYRAQWLGMEGQPNTFNLNGNTSLLGNKAGAGFTLSYDQIGNTKNTEFNAAFAYKLDLGRDRTFKFRYAGGRIELSD